MKQEFNRDWRTWVYGGGSRPPPRKLTAEDLREIKRRARTPGAELPSHLSISKQYPPKIKYCLRNDILREIEWKVLKENNWILKKRPPRKRPLCCPYYIEPEKFGDNAYCKAIPGEIAGPRGILSHNTGNGILERLKDSADTLTSRHCRDEFVNCGWYERTLFKRTITKRTKQFIEEVIDLCLREIRGFGLLGEDFFVEKHLKRELTYNYEIIEREEEIENAEEEDLSYLRRWPSHRVRFERVAGPSR